METMCTTIMLSEPQPLKKQVSTETQLRTPIDGEQNMKRKTEKQKEEKEKTLTCVDDGGNVLLQVLPVIHHNL